MKSKKTPEADLENIIPLLIGIWRRFHQLSGPQDRLQTREFRQVVEKVAEINEDKFQGKDYFADRDLLGAYLLYHFVLHYQEGLSLIQEVPFQPKRVLDICAGPCAFSFAALRHGAQEVIAIDRNQTALEIGAEVCGRYGFPITIRQWLYGKNPLPVTGKFDLIILGYCLEELLGPNLDKWQTFIQELLERLTPHGCLLLVDSSALQVNLNYLKLRDQLVKNGIPVQAPCVWRGECPALAKGNSPCYAQREMEKPYLIKELQRAASINLSSLKMTYLLLRNPESGWPSLPPRDMYRVISPPVDTYHGKRYYLCGTDGGKRLESHLKEHPKESRAFEYLRRGELISFENAMLSPTTIDIVKDTKVKVEAACGKPLLE